MAKARRSHRTLKWLGLGVLALALAVLVAIPVALKSDRVVGAVQAKLLPRLSQKLGREVKVARIEPRLFPPAVTLEGFEIAGGPGEPPFLTARRTELHPKLWPLVRSLGTDVQLDGVRVEGAELAVVKRRDGTWSHEELGQAEQGGAGSGSSVAWVLSDLEVLLDRVRMIDRSAGPARELVLPGVSLRSESVGFDRPLVAELTASLGQEENVTGQLRLDRLPPSFSDLPPGQWPKLSGELAMTAVPLELFRDFLPSGLSELITGGVIGAKTTLGTGADGAWTVQGPMTLGDVRMRGEPASGEVRLSATLPPWEPQAFVVQLDGLRLRGPGVDLGGSARATGQPLAVDFAVQGGLLDLDTLLGALPQAPDDVAAARAPGRPRALVSPEAREGLRSLAARGTLKLGKVVSGKLTATDLDATAKLQNGVLTFETARAGFFGGRVDATGTRLDVTQPTPRWTLKAALEAVDLGAAFAAVTGHQPMAGRLGGQLQLEGAGNDWTALRQTLIGAGELAMKEGALNGVDTASQLAGVLTRALGAGRFSNALGAATEGTALRDLQASFQVKDGWMALKRPLTFQSRFGSARLGGRIGLDERLELEGAAEVTPDFVARLSAGKLRPKEAVDVPLSFGGTLRAPKLGTGSPGDVAKDAVADKVRDRAADELQRRARRALPWLRR